MKAFFNIKMVLLLLVGLFTSIGCGVEKAELDEIVDQQESFVANSRAENVTITGTIINPRTQGPVAGAIVSIGLNTAVTDEDGVFSIELDETNPGAVVEVAKEGFVDFKFSTDFRGYANNETTNWAFELPEIQDEFTFAPGFRRQRTFFYLGEAYVVSVPANAASRAIDISVGPTGTVVGKGISGNFAVVGFWIGTSEEAFEFDNDLSVAYHAYHTVTKGGVGSVNQRALTPASTPGAAIAAANVNAAIKAAEAIFANGGSDAQANAAVIEGIYHGADEVSIDEDGDAVLVSTLEGCHYPGNGVLTEEDKVQQIDEKGKPVQGEEEDLIDNGGVIENIPHQAPADAG